MKVAKKEMFNPSGVLPALVQQTKWGLGLARHVKQTQVKTNFFERILFLNPCLFSEGVVGSVCLRGIEMLPRNL